MFTRSADSSIKGYFYQFNTSILQILNLNSDADSVTIEGIEDFDVSSLADTTTVQCKYLSRPKFIHSIVREPITAMLDHFVLPNNTSNLNYVLYAHFEDESPGTTVDIDLGRLKDILTYKENKIQKCHFTDHSITDEKLTAFLLKFKLIFGQELGEQQKAILRELKRVFSCSENEADLHFYNNSIRIIIEKAVLPNVEQRKITKRSFLTAIDCRETLFTPWYIRFKSKTTYLNLLKQTLRSTKALDPVRQKCIFIGRELFTADNAALPVIGLIENLIARYFKLHSALRNAKPLSFVLDCNETDLVQIKKGLIANQIRFNDGWEHIEFNAIAFNEAPVINTNKGQTKIAHASYLIRLISLRSFILGQAEISKPKVVLHFSKADCPYQKDPLYQWYDIKYCEDLKDISTLLI